MRLRIRPALGRERLGEVTLPRLQRYVDQLAADGHAPQTIALSVAPLRAIYTRANRLGEVRVNPTRGLALPAARPSQRRVASPKEIDRILSVVGVGDRALWATAIYAGLRRGELLALRWEDVDLAAGVIHVRRGWDNLEGEIEPKSRRGRRRVPVPAVLRDYLVERRLDTGEYGQVFGSANRARKMIERRARGPARGRTRPVPAPRLPALLRLNDDRRRRERQVPVGVPGARRDRDHVRPYGHLMPGSHGEAAGLLDALLARAAGGGFEGPTAPRTAPHPARSRS